MLHRVEKNPRTRSWRPPAPRLTWLAIPLALGLSSCARSGSADPRPATEAETWIAMTCYVESPEAIGWRRYRFMDVSIAVPPGYTVSTTSRSLRARNGKGGLTIRATSDLLPPQLRARPARATTEAACESRVAGYPGTISASYNDGEFWVMAEWFGTSFWADGDWPKKLVAVINATRLEDAALLRTALHTVRAERMAR